MRAPTRIAALGVAFFAVLLVGISALEQWGPFRPVRPTRVVVLGDSLTVQASWSIDRELNAAGYDAAVSGQNGAVIADRMNEIRSYNGYSGADIAVLALGTNNAYFMSGDNTRRVTLDETKRDITKAVDEAFAPHNDSPFPNTVTCVVWVTVNDRAHLIGLDTKAPPVNQAIRDEAATRTAAGKQMLVADWTTRSQGHDDWFVADGLHLTPAGQEAYGQLIRESAQRCHD